jgi:hypothetical protein
VAGLLQESLYHHGSIEALWRGILYAHTHAYDHADWHRHRPAHNGLQSYADDNRYASNRYADWHPHPDGKWHTPDPDFYVDADDRSISVSWIHASAHI